jgi:hypothetical protein
LVRCAEQPWEEHLLLDTCHQNGLCFCPCPHPLHPLPHTASSGLMPAGTSGAQDAVTLGILFIHYIYHKRRCGGAGLQVSDLVTKLKTGALGQEVRVGEVELQGCLSPLQRRSTALYVQNEFLQGTLGPANPLWFGSSLPDT